MIKSIAVELPLNDMAKREAILNKLGFDVTKAIEIKNTKYDGED
jgi:adenylate cyclase class IV